MNGCTCRPGDEANGWHEFRCQPCIDDELGNWSYIVTISTGQYARLTSGDRE